MKRRAFVSRIKEYEDQGVYAYMGLDKEPPPHTHTPKHTHHTKAYTVHTQNPWKERGEQKLRFSKRWNGGREKVREKMRNLVSNYPSPH